MLSRTACPGCGVDLPPTTSAEPSALHASPACEALHHEILGFAHEHPVMLRYHQLTVDTYGAQHAGGPAPQIRVVYGLAGLWLSIEHDFSGEDVRAVHRRMGRPTADWPSFDPPAPPQHWLTVADVAEAGAHARSEAGHARAIAQWSESVWETWCEVVPGTDDAIERVLHSMFVDSAGRSGLHGTIGSASAVHRLRGLLGA